MHHNMDFKPLEKPGIPHIHKFIVLWGVREEKYMH